MSQRDELASLVYAHGLNGTPNSVADAILDAGYSRPRVVETIEELVALPAGSVVLTEQGGVYEVAGSIPYQTWRETGSRYVHTPSDLALPATVLHQPEESND